MGVNGTEVTKEAGDMVLTDDNFATIVAAVERGRAIYDNIVTFVRFQLTTNVSAILTILVAQLAGLGALFNAIQILFVNIIADGPPAMAIGVDPPKPGVMERPPRDRHAAILTWARLGRIVVSGVVIAGGTLGLYVRAAARSGPRGYDSLDLRAHQLVNSSACAPATGRVQPLQPVELPAAVRCSASRRCRCGSCVPFRSVLTRRRCRWRSGVGRCSCRCRCCWSEVRSWSRRAAA